MFGYNKFAFTLKFLIGVSPVGPMTFVGKSCGGRASDNIIFELGNMIELLDRFGAVMVDGGMKIDDLCNEKVVTSIVD